MKYLPIIVQCAAIPVYVLIGYPILFFYGVGGGGVGRGLLDPWFDYVVYNFLEKSVLDSPPIFRNPVINRGPCVILHGMIVNVPPGLIGFPHQAHRMDS